LKKPHALTPLERRSIAVLAGIYGLRIMGLFLILPVFALYAAELEGQTPFLIGLALGAYGLTQALLQIPYGMLSDRFGRKPMIVAGLLVFALGSFIAASADSVLGVIVGRAVQGAGAIASVVIAMTADLTREEQRTKAMAVIGITIGATFTLSLIVGPLLNGAIGVPGIFSLTGVLALSAIGVLLLFVPTPARAKRQGRGSLPAQFLRILKDKQLLRLDVGIFFLHLVLTAMFVVLPTAIVTCTDLHVDQHWKLYLPVMAAAFATMAPFIFLSHKPHGTRPVLAGAVAVLIVAEGVFFFGHQSLWGLVLGLWLFFTAFNLLEAMLPSLISRLAPASNKGAAIGVYSSAQFLGAFAGGALGGLLHGAFGIPAVFVLSAVVLTVWCVIALTMPEPKLLETRELHVGRQAPAQARHLTQELEAIPGVTEAVVIADEGIAYLKVDAGVLDEHALHKFSVVV